MSVRVLEGHVLSVLSREQAASYHCCVTSPPYWLLRSYSTEPQVWPSPDGEPLCAPEQHEWEHLLAVAKAHNTDATYSRLSAAAAAGGLRTIPASAFCARCHAWRGELGQEPTPELYVAHLVACFRAVRRVLRDDGTLWVNLAGCYFNDPGGQNGGSRNGTGASTLMHDGRPDPRPGTKLLGLHAISAKAVEANRQAGRQDRTGRGHPWLKPLDWVDVPGLFARAMQQDGWYWRSDVTWVKPSALPESVSGTRWEKCRVSVRPTPRSSEPSKGASPHGPQSVGLMAANTTRPNNPTTLAAREALAEWADCPGCPRCAPHGGYVLRRGNGRPTKSSERVLVFCKKPAYYWDQEAIRENLAEATIERDQYTHIGGQRMAALRPGDSQMNTDGVTRTTAGLVRERTSPAAGRNCRDVWVISPEPLRDSHYAAFPTELPARAIKAGTSEWGCCPACGAPWARVVERERLSDLTVRYVPGVSPKHADMQAAGLRSAASGLGGSNSHNSETPTSPAVTTLGWRPTCRCCVVCDTLGTPAHQRGSVHGAPQGPGSGEGVAPSVALSEVPGEPQLQGRGRAEEAEAPSGVRPLRGGVPGPRRDEPVLQSDLFGQMDVGARSAEPIPAGRVGPVPGLARETGAPSGDGGALGTSAAPDGARSPHQRGPGRQSDREPGRADAEGAQPGAHEAPSHRLTPYDPVPCRVLDPFAGAGSTALAANRLGRDCTLVELKPQYAQLARTRIGREPLSLFASLPEEIPV